MSTAWSVTLNCAKVTHHTTQTIGNAGNEDVVYEHSIQLLSKADE